MNSFVYIVTCRNQLEVARLKNLFLIAVLKLGMEDSFGCTTIKLKGWEKSSIQYKLIIQKHGLACILLI